MRKNRVILIAMIMVIGTFGIPIALSTPAKADTTYWVSVCPVSKNATWDIYYGKFHLSDEDVDEVEKANDSSTIDLYSTVSVQEVIVTNDFNNLTEWEDIAEYPGDDEYRARVGYLPPTGATVTNMYILAWFTYYRPELDLEVSIDNGTYWYGGAHYSESSPPFGYDYALWSMTSISWTPENINSTDLSIMMTCYPSEGVHYYLDYLGMVIYWQGEFAGGGEQGEIWEPEEDTGPTYSFDMIWEDGGIMGILGISGLVLMVASMPLGVYMHRHSDKSAVIIFIEVVCIFTIAFTLLMMSIS